MKNKLVNECGREGAIFSTLLRVLRLSWANPGPTYDCCPLRRNFYLTRSKSGTLTLSKSDGFHSSSALWFQTAFRHQTVGAELLASLLRGIPRRSVKSGKIISILASVFITLCLQRARVYACITSSLILTVSAFTG